MTGAGRRIAEEIEARGPMAFSRFMEIALYDAEHGYYRSARDPFGREGDFFTASQLQPVFGRVAAATVRAMKAEMGAGEEFRVVEWGAGRGEMAEAFGEFGYTAVDVGRGAAPGSFTGVVFANELFDALPVDVMRRSGGVWRAMLVGRKGEEGLGWVEGPVVEDFVEEAEDGRWRERAVRMEETLGAMVAGLERGYVVAIDYGYTRRELGRFPQGTLMAYRRHQALDDIFERPGEQDLTAHVDWDALHECARGLGLEAVRFESLMQWVLRAGEADQFERVLEAEGEAEAARLRGQLKTLLVSMGEAFRVAAWGRNLKKGQ